MLYSKLGKKQRLAMDKTLVGYLKRTFLDPFWALSVVLHHFVSKYIKDDKMFIKWEFFCGMHKYPNLEEPKTYNEKIQWMKLYDHNPEYTRMVDKITAKDYVTEKLGTDENIIPTLGIWDSFEDVNFEILPNKFVMKTTHDSGGIVICKDKRKFDTRAAKIKISKSLEHNYYLDHREWPYKYVRRRIIVEKYMVDESKTELKDYKFFCFDGEPKFMFIATDRAKDICFDFFDMDFKHLPFEQGHPNARKPISKPEGWNDMLDLARKLSKGLYAVRVDLYNINGKIYFGELTFFHFSGNVPFVPDEWDYKIGEMLHLPHIR